ncbi:MAG: hypothetical protein IPN90_04600 [Elusimicrobia bacterium]|nr:hypothetical protein [Elusimicrobiota bacterium]
MKRQVVHLADELYDPLEREAHKRGTTLTEMVSTYLRREFPRVYFEYIWERCKDYHAQPSSTPSGGAICVAL